MMYETFTTLAAAQSALADHRAAGKRGYMLHLGVQRFEVRTWA